MCERGRDRKEGRESVWVSVRVRERGVCGWIPSVPLSCIPILSPATLPALILGVWIKDSVACRVYRGSSFIRKRPPPGTTIGP